MSGITIDLLLQTVGSIKAHLRGVEKTLNDAQKANRPMSDKERKALHEKASLVVGAAEELMTGAQKI